MGGSLPPDELNAFLAGYLDVSDHEHDILVHSLNELFAERHQNHPLAYAHDPAPTT